jgi:hypothetical protein
VRPEKTGSIDCYTRRHVAGVPEPSPLARLMIVASVLSRCSQYVIQSSGTEVPPWDVRSQYQQVHSALLYLETELQFGLPVCEAVEQVPNAIPDSHEGAMIMISYAMYHVCHCLLSNASHLRQRTITSPVVPPPTFMRHAAEDNRTHAVELSRSLGYSSTTGIAARCSFLSYCAIVSAVIHAVNCNSEMRETKNQSEECLEVCSQFLARNSAYWHNAGVMVSNSSPRQCKNGQRQCTLKVLSLTCPCSTTLFFTSRVSQPNSITTPIQQTKSTLDRHICTLRLWPISRTTDRSPVRGATESSPHFHRALLMTFCALQQPSSQLEPASRPRATPQAGQTLIQQLLLPAPALVNYWILGCPSVGQMYLGLEMGTACSQTKHN